MLGVLLLRVRLRPERWFGVIDLKRKEEGISFLFFVFLLYLFFLYLRPVTLFAPWLEPFRPMLILWLITFTGSLFHVLSKKDASATRTHYWLLFSLMMAVAFSLFTKGRIGDGIAAISEFSASVLLFFLVSFNVRNLKQLRAACFVILFCLFTLAALGVYSYHTGYMSEELVLQQRKDDFTIEAPKERPPIPAEDKSGAFLWRVRSVGFFNDPNDFAQTLLIGMPMLLWFYKKGAWFRNTMTVAIPAAVMGYCITLTNSRGALLGIASLLFFGVKNKLGTMRTGLILGAVALGWIVIGAAGGRAFSSKERSAEERIEAWYEGFQMFKSSPIFGVGYGTFTERYYMTAHNSFVLCFSEIGLFGFFCWVSLLVLGFMTVGRVADHAPSGSESALAGNILRSALLGYLTCAWFLSRTYQPVLFCVLALCTAVWVCARRSPECAGVSELQKPLLWVKPSIVVMILSMGAVYVFIAMR